MLLLALIVQAACVSPSDPTSETLATRQATVAACDARLASDSQDIAAYRVLQGALNDPLRRVAVLKLAVHHAPLDPELQLNLGLALRVTEQLSEALVAFRRAARLSPTDVSPRTEAGLTAAQLGRHSEAIAHYEDAIDISPTDGYAWGYLARSLHALGRHAEAVRAWDRAEVLIPTGFIDEADDRDAYARSRRSAGLTR